MLRKDLKPSKAIKLSAKIKKTAPVTAANSSIATNSAIAAAISANDSVAMEIAFANTLAEYVKLQKIVSRCNNSVMDVYNFLIFFIATISLANTSINNLYTKKLELAKHFGFCKATLYNAIKHTNIDWSGISYAICLEVAEQIFANSDRPLYFVLNKDVILRPGSKKVDLLARVFDLDKKRYGQGFTILTLGITDGECIVPINFTLLAAEDEESLIKKGDNQHKSEREIKLTTKAGRNRKKACQPQIDAAIAMLKKACYTKLAVNFLLLDSYFAEIKQIKSFASLGLNVVCSLPFNQIKYKTVEGASFTLTSVVTPKKQRIKQGQPYGAISKEFFVNLGNGDDNRLKSKIVLVPNWRQVSTGQSYLALLCTNTNFTQEQIQQAYDHRWLSDLLFMRLKGRMALQSGNNTRIFESNVACISIALLRYAMILLAQHKLFPNCSFRQVMEKFNG